MRILHTSDWHLGHMLYNYDRTAEQESMLGQMADIVSEEKPDVFLVSGDIYHTSQPSASVQTMFTDALVNIHRANPSMTIVITAGNHDSATRHEIYRNPLEPMGIYMVGTIDRENPSSHIIEIEGKGFVVAVPYANERNIPEGFLQQLLDITGGRNTQDLPVVMSAHTTVRGCDFSGHDHASELSVGGIDTMDISLMGEGYDYLALGHIHHAQFVHTGKHNVRYSGTPLAVSFDESYPHSVSIVDISAHGDRPEVREREIVNPHPLVTLPTHGFASWEDAKGLLSGFPSDIAAYIRLNVETGDFLPAEAYNEAQRLTGFKACRFCHINSRRRLSATGEAVAMTVQEFREEMPMDIAMRYANDTGMEFTDGMKELFSQVMGMLSEQENI